MKIDEREGVDEQFDQYGLASVLKDYMYADKATRYQIVKNHFERAVTNAKVGERREGREKDSEKERKGLSERESER